MTNNRIIGKDNDLPWDLPDDWQRLHNMVKDKNIVMGRKTYESNKSFLSDKTNYIFSTHENLDLPDNCVQVKDLVDFMQKADGEVYVLGGGAVYETLLPHCNRLHLTLIQTELEGDTEFPELDEDNWVLESSIYHQADEKHEFPFYFNSYIQKRK